MLYFVLGVCHLLVYLKCRASPSCHCQSSSGFGAQESTLQQQRDGHMWVCPCASVVAAALSLWVFSWVL